MALVSPTDIQGQWETGIVQFKQARTQRTRVAQDCTSHTSREALRACIPAHLLPGDLARTPSTLQSLCSLKGTKLAFNHGGVFTLHPGKAPPPASKWMGKPTLHSGDFGGMA